MSIKRFTLIILLTIMILFIAGCRQDGNQTEAEKTTPSNILHELDNSTLSEEEYRLRRAINSLSMYQEVTGQDYKVEISHIEKYGIENFSRYDNWYSLLSLNDMITMLENKDFQQNFYDSYGYDLGINMYYLPSSSISQNYEAEMLTIDLIVWDDDYNLCISGTEVTGKTYLIWSTFDTRESINVKEVAEFYAGVDGLDLGTSQAENGSIVYYLSSGNGSVLFEDMGLNTDNFATAYLWQQDDVIGVMILQGEFSEENLDLCVLERHEI